MKRVDHPETGPLEFECQVLHIPDTGQRLITYCAAPGSPTRAAFRWLAQQSEPAPLALAPAPAPTPAPASGPAPAPAPAE